MPVGDVGALRAISDFGAMYFMIASYGTLCRIVMPLGCNERRFQNLKSQIGRFQQPQMNSINTPITLSEQPSAAEFPLPSYDWKEQIRHHTIIAGRYTANSVQTFDSQGRPKDSTSDNND